MKKILCLIDSLGAGGAERQMSYLAILLKQRGHGVRLVAFTSQNKFYEDFLLENGVTPEYNERGLNKWKRIREIAKIVKSYKPDLVIAYKGGVCISSILAKALCRFKLVVSERTTTFSPTRFDRMKFFLYRFAEWIVPNSESQAKFIKKNYPDLSSKVKTIFNTIDTELFAPADKRENDLPVIITTATVYHAKNTKSLVAAAKILRDRGKACLFQWYGKRFAGDPYADEVADMIRQYDLQEIFYLQPASSRVNELYGSADIFCLPSFVEGFPNVICEAMASGLPIVCSNVCDNPNIVENDVNGFLFDPSDPVQIADKLQQAMELSISDRAEMGRRNREKIVNLCSPDKFIDNYLSLI